MPYRNIEDRRSYDRAWYKRLSVTKKKSRVKISGNRRKNVALWLRKYKSTKKCKHCPETHISCLEFHHKDNSDKVIDISNAVRNGWSVERLRNEIGKCDILCANCHRKVHFK